MAFDLTTLVRVKRVIDLTEATKDTLLQEYIDAASDAIEKFMDRPVLVAARTELYDVEPGQQRIALRAFPVLAAPVAVFKNDSARQFGAGIAALAADSFYLNLVTGSAEFDRVRLIRGPGVVEVVYTGGMAADTAAFIVAFPEIAKACDTQVAFMYKRRETMGMSGFSSEGGSVSFSEADDLIVPVKAAVRKYRRLDFGN